MRLTVFSPSGAVSCRGRGRLGGVLLSDDARNLTGTAPLVDGRAHEA
jgi:hypothetical protein